MYKRKGFLFIWHLCIYASSHCLSRYLHNANRLEEMAAVLGDGKLSVIKRWLRAATAIRKQDAFMHALSQASWLPVGFVLVQRLPRRRRETGEASSLSDASLPF